MRIFLLEDSVKRLQRFRRAFKDQKIIHTASALEAIDLLSTESFDLIFLDHDLTEHDTDWIAEGTGYDVALFLGNNNTPNDQALILVHTMNPEAGDRMVEALKSRRVRRISIIDIISPDLFKKLK